MVFRRVLCISLFASIFFSLPIAARAQTSSQTEAPLGAAGVQEQIEWTWEVRPPKADPRLPNVLLVGDSISRNYYPEVQKRLASLANVYLFATSACAGDPRLPEQVRDFARMENASFKVIHFNNGMHGWTYSEADYAVGLQALLKAVREIAPRAKLVWADTTPVRVSVQPGPTNARVDARNAAAQALMKANRIPIDDQFALMKGHPDLYEDDVHFNAAGAALQGEQAATLIEAALQKE